MEVDLVPAMMLLLGSLGPEAPVFAMPISSRPGLKGSATGGPVRVAINRNKPQHITLKKRTRAEESLGALTTLELGIFANAKVLKTSCCRISLPSQSSFANGGNTKGRLFADIQDLVSGGTGRESRDTCVGSSRGQWRSLQHPPCQQCPSYLMTKLGTRCDSERLPPGLYLFLFPRLVKLICSVYDHLMRIHWSTQFAKQQTWQWFGHSIFV